MPGPGLRRVVALALLLLFVLPALPAQADRVSRTSIGNARALPLGTVVSVSGVATTPSGVFESSFGDKGFAIQDRVAGLYVRTADDLGVEPGRVVEVTGTLTDSFGLLVIVPRTPDDVSLGGSRRPPLPRAVTTAGVGESTEGTLVVLRGNVTRGPVDDLPYGTKLYVDDGSGETTVFVNVQTGISLRDAEPGKRVQVVGFSSQFADHYEIDPRGPVDVQMCG